MRTYLLIRHIVPRPEKEVPRAFCEEGPPPGCAQMLGQLAYGGGGPSPATRPGAGATGVPPAGQVHAVNTGYLWVMPHLVHLSVRLLPSL
jgi:hypothetical protein